METSHPTCGRDGLRFEGLYAGSSRDALSRQRPGCSQYRCDVLRVSAFNSWTAGDGFYARRREDVPHGWTKTMAGLISLAGARRNSSERCDEVLLDAGFVADTSLFTASAWRK